MVNIRMRRIPAASLACALRDREEYEHLRIRLHPPCQGRAVIADLPSRAGERAQPAVDQQQPTPEQYAHQRRENVSLENRIADAHVG